MRKRRKFDTTSATVGHDAICVVTIDHFNHCARLRGVVRNRVAVGWPNWPRGSQAHQRIAVSRSHIGSVEEFFHGESGPLWRKFCATGKDTGDPCLTDCCPLFLKRQCEGFEQFGRREHAANIVAGFENCDCLINAVLLVSL